MFHICFPGMPSHIKNYQAKKKGSKKTIRQRKPAEVLALVDDWRKDMTTIQRMMAQLKGWAFDPKMTPEFRLASSREYMDRVLGKPKQEMDVTFTASDDMMELYKRALGVAQREAIDADVIHGAMKSVPNLSA